jgi:hypothetical protein
LVYPSIQDIPTRLAECEWTRLGLLAFAEFAVVLGDGFLPAFGNLLAAGAADAAAGSAVVHLAAEFHFDLFDTGEGGLNAVGQERVVGLSEGVELAEIAHEALDVTGGGGIVLHLLLELHEALHGIAVSLLELLLPDGAVGAVPGSAVHGSAIPVSTTALVATLLATTLLAWLALLALLAALALLSLLALLAALALLALLPLLALLAGLLALLTLLALLSGLLTLLALLTLLPLLTLLTLLALLLAAAAQLTLLALLTALPILGG